MRPYVVTKRRCVWNENISIEFHFMEQQFFYIHQISGTPTKASNVALIVFASSVKLLLGGEEKSKRT